VDRSDCFQHLIERVCTRINGCKEEGLIGSAMETEIRASFIILQRRKKKNIIKFVNDSNGNRVEGNDQLASLIQGYFEGLFTSEVLAPDPGLLGKVNRRVTEEMNASLLAPFTADEVKAAL